MQFGKSGILLAAALAAAVAAASPAAARPWHGGWHRGAGAGAAIGFATGALIGSALASRPYYGGYGPYYAYGEGPYVVEDSYAAADPGVAYCMRRFKSYDPASGTYLGYDGVRHPCP